MKIKDLATKAIAETGSKVEVAALMAFMATESGGSGFDTSTGKIVIQFEPHLFARYTGLPHSTSNTQVWDENKVDVQSKEWVAFNDAFKINPDAAMRATSIGLPQILGVHWKRLGFDAVGGFWDYMKVSELNQVKMLIKFIETDKNLLKAIVDKDWHVVASLYNGSGYRDLAIKLKREPYDVTMAKYYKKYST